VRCRFFASLAWVAAALVLSCGTTSTSTSPTGAGDASVDSASDAGAPADASADAPLVPAAPDPGKLACGGETCTVPGSVCCVSSIAPGGAADHCAIDGTACGAPNDGCDETADCGQGQICCTGAGALPLDASVSGIEVTFCIDQSEPTSCIPHAGVGNSSIQVCKTDAECKNGQPCALQRCFGRVLQTCGPDPECK
jgi:hypothetical protein